METQTFTVRPREIDLTLLPIEARTPGTPAFRNAVSAFFETAFTGFGGQASVLVKDEAITISWNPDPSRKNPLQVIVGNLQNGRQAEGIQLLELLLTRDPDNVDVLYNLGMALSDAGKFEIAEKHLRHALELAPGFANALIALGIALSRQHKEQEARTALESAIELEPDNLWARRNLGVVLLKQGSHADAIEHLQRAVEVFPGDQVSWLMLGDAVRLSGNAKEAELAYRRAIALNEHTDFAESARLGLNTLARATFESKTGGAPRPDAIEYCAAAIKKFSAMSPEQVKGIAAEISILGRSGFDINNPSKRYTLKSVPGDFSGLQLVSYMYVAFQIIAPGTATGFDLSREYQIAQTN